MCKQGSRLHQQARSSGGFGSRPRSLLISNPELLALGGAALSIVLSVIAWLRPPEASLEARVMTSLAGAESRCATAAAQAQSACQAILADLEGAAARVTRERARISVERHRIEDPSYGHRTRRGGDGHRPTPEEAPNGGASPAQLSLEKWLQERGH